MNLHDYLAALRTHWIVIALLTMIGGACAYAYSQSIQPQYRSEVEVVVVPTRGDDTSDLLQGSNYAENLVQTYTLLATSSTVLQPVIDDLGLDDTPRRLALRMDVEVPLNTVIIRIGVTDPNAELAQRTANAIADELATAVTDVSPVGADDEPAVRIVTIADAVLPSFAVSPNTRQNTAIGAMAGMLIGVAFAVVRRRFWTRVSNAATVAEITEAPVLGEIPTAADGQTVAAALRSSPHGRVSESMRQVAANLRFVDIDHKTKVILVTSGSAMEGKSSVSLGLALTLADAGSKVLYIEADLRRPSASKYSQLEGEIGLTSVLVGEIGLATAAQEWAMPNLHVLTAGRIPPNPGHLLSSGRLQGVIDEARSRYEYVIVDTAPMLMVSDAIWLSSFVDGILFVVRANRTKGEDFRRALTNLENNPTPLLGVVVDGVRRGEENPYYTEEADGSDGVFDGLRRAVRLGS